MPQAPGIYGFFGPNRTGSNFHICSGKLVYNDLESDNTESLYQALKTLDKDLQREIAKMHPKQAKWAGRKLKLRNDWEIVKDPIMAELTRVKYKLPVERKWLLGTHGLYLEETNTWGDKYWGVCNGQGLNKLGHTLMRERTIIEREIENASRA
jgi:predicted NAD-dependent protein-ADP-ribosyltransferase YbiA (DUF1768 family)